MTAPPPGKLFDLTNHQALVTGASRGIGLAIAEGLRRQGAAVCITGRKRETLQAAADALRQQPGPEVLPIVCHQGDATAIAQLFAQLDQQHFLPDIVVINAATNPVKVPLADLEAAAWQKILDVNLTGGFLTAQQALKRLVPLGRGSLIFIASIAGIDPIPSLGAYSVSKAGLIGLVKALAKEVGPAGIRVNALAPGLVETHFSAALFADAQAYGQLLAHVPLKRHGQPEDMVGAAVFLASTAAAYLTGQVLVIDGGGRV